MIMKIGTTSMEMAIALTPLSMVSWPSVAPIFSSSRGVGLSEAGRLPARRMAISRFRSVTGIPSMIPSSSISCLMLGADINWLSSRIASEYWNASPSSGKWSRVRLPNLRPPDGLKWKPTAGCILRSVASDTYESMSPVML